MLKKLLLPFLFVAFFVNMAFAQTGSITGTVTNEQGEPVPTANVLLVEIGRGAATSLQGEYTIEDVPAGTYTLRVTFIGYGEYSKQVTIEAGQTLTHDVILTSSAVGLEELVVTGYGTESKKKSVAAIASVSGEELATQPVASVGEALVGQAAGVNISTFTGQPGADTNISIRGVGSLNGATEPIVILNGVPINGDNLSMINMNAIKDISILKGPSATAIYGSEGANGVIVIRTRTGNYNTPLQISYDGSIKTATLRDEEYNILSGPELLRLERSLGAHEAAVVGNKDGVLTDAEIAAAPTTDWVDYFFDPTFSQSHNFSFSRGYDDVRLFTGIEYTKQLGALNTGTGFQRFNLTNNLSGRSEDRKFTYELNTMLSYLINDTQTSLGTGGINQNPLLGAKQAVPYITPEMYPGSGAKMISLFFSNPTFAYTPLFLIDKMKYTTNETREIDAVLSLKTSYELLDNLLLVGSIGGQYERDNDEYTQSPLSFNSILFASGADTPGSTFNATTRTLTYELTTALKYQTDFSNRHQLDAAVYFELDQGFYKAYGFTQEGLIAKTFDPGDGDGFVDDNASNDFYVDDVFLNSLRAGGISYFGTLGYDYDNRYGVDLSLRRDASYRFIDENRWGTFYSVGAYWNIAEESFMDSGIFGLLKLRAAYGKTGQSQIVDADGQFAPFIANSLTRSLYGTGGGYGGLSSFFLAQIGNPLLKWETVYKIDIGLDFRAFNARFNGSIDVYRETTEDLFNTKPVSSITSVTALNANIGSMRNQGIEVELNYQLLRSTNGLNVTLGFTGAYNQNTILDIPDKDGQIIQGLTILKEGGSLGQYYLVPYVGVNNETGNLLFRAQDGTLTETPTLPQDKRFTGKDIYPEYQGTVSLDLRYKGLFLLTDWDFTVGVYRLDFRYAGLVDPNSIGQFAMGEDILDSWTSDNKDAPLPSYNASNLAFNFESDRFLRNSDYFRLRFIKLGYQIPVELLANLNLSGATVYVSGTNVFAITPWEGLDPSLDSNNGRLYPNPQIFSAGININF